MQRHEEYVPRPFEGAEARIGQPGLFDEPQKPAAEPTPPTVPPATAHRRPAPIAANADPVSSHLAAETIRTSGTETNQMRAIVDWMRANACEPLTSFELSVYGGFPRYNVGRRMKTLERQGKVERCEKRICRESQWSIKKGIRCETWFVLDRDTAPKNHPRAEAAPAQREQPREQLADTVASEFTSTPQPARLSAEDRRLLAQAREKYPFAPYENLLEAVADMRATNRHDDLPGEVQNR